MDKTQAQEFISNVFQSKFDPEQYALLVRNLLNNFEHRENNYQGGSLWEAYREHISQYRRIGKYTDPNGDAMDILIVEVKSLSKLDRARTSLRNFVVKHLQTFEKDYAIAAFYSKEDGGKDWRFSFVKIEIESERTEEGKIKARKELTPAKRYSFLVGAYENSYTAQKQLLPLLLNDYSNPTIEDIENTFSIEKVTDEFFEQYKELYLKLSENKDLSEILVNVGLEPIRFTKKLLGQIVFLYFLQKKGWLGVPKNETWGKGDKKYMQNLFNEAFKNDKNYFKDYLQYLFYEALAKDRRDTADPVYYRRFDCKIPFLNGGLFEVDYDWEKSNIVIPNNLFRNEEKNKAGDKGTGIFDVFDRYNFTIKEDEPLEKEVAVDPEMLGKVFENMLEIKERKSKGAYYTPREIVHYMCQESLINYIDTAVNDYSTTYQAVNTDQLNIFGGSHDKKGQMNLEIEHKSIKIPKEEIELFIRKGYLAVENDKQVLSKGKETDRYKFQLPESIQINADLIDEKLSSIKICDPAIGSGAFPVGLLHELVIAQKVLFPFLSNKYLAKKLETIELTHEEYKHDPERYIYKTKRHTIQESIYGVDIDASAIDIARLRLWLSLIVDETDFYNIEALPNLDYKIVHGDSLVGFPDDWKSEAFDKIEKLKKEHFSETDTIKRKHLKSQIDKEINDRLITSKQVFGYVVNFDFRLFFSEVWHYKEGFDIVIGNPPYISYYGNNGQNIDDTTRNFFKLYYNHVKKTNDRINSMNLMTEKGLRILNKSGFLSFITNKTLAVLPSYLNLREYLLQSYYFDYIVSNLDPFSAIVDCVIFGICKKKRSNKTKFYKGQILNFKEVNQDIFFKNNKLELTVSENLNIIEKIENNKNRLENILTINRGVNIGGCFNYFLSKEPKKGYYPYLSGTKNIKKYYYKWEMEDGYFSFNEKKEQELRDEGATIVLGNHDRYLKPRLFIPESGQTIMAAFSSERIYGSYGLLVGTSNSLHELKYCCAVLNSDIITFFAVQKEILRKGEKATPHVGVRGLNSIPIPTVENNTLKSISTLVDFIVFAKRNNIPVIISNFFEYLVNSIVFEIYFQDEFRVTKKEIITHIGNLKPIVDSMTDEEKLAVIQTEFDRLYDPNHPIRNNLETLDSLEEVRIIKEALK